MNTLKPLSLALCSIALGVAISYAGMETGLAYIAANTMMSACAVAIIYVLHSMSSSLRASANRACEFMNAIGRASYYTDSKVPAAGAVERASRSCADPYAAGMLRNIALRMQLGQGAQEAADSASSPDRRIHNMLEQHMRGGDFDFGAAFSAYSVQREERDSANSSAMPRYSTMNMFISTVAPSFVIFSFIGSMLISQQAESIAMMSFELIIALPIMYAVSSYALNRRLFG